MSDTEVTDVAKFSLNYSQSDDWLATTCHTNITQSPSTAVVAKVTVTSSSVNSAQITQMIAIIVGLAAIVTNGFVLFIMIYYKQVTKKTTNAFIFNQSVIDLLASLGLVVSTLLKVVGISSRLISNLAAKILFCLVFESGVLFNSPIYASMTSLVVITVERYFKVVHPIIHRNHFRRWMIKLGVVLPWVMGAIIYLLPAWSSTRITNGLCAPFQFPSTQLFSAYSATAFAYNMFVFPLLIFVFCYGKIIVAIRHQSQVHHSTEVDQTSSSRAAGSSSSSGNHKGNTTNHVTESQKKVIKTVMITTVTFLLCWLPTSFYQTAVNLKLLPNQSSVIFSLAALAYLNLFLNPVIYAAHFDVMKKLFNLVLQVFNIAH